MKISACWIAKNEEKDIGRSIESVKDICDELLVVDTGSTDGTAQAAEAAGARVLPFAWEDDFSAARNFALDHVDGDLVIFLDADEWFDPRLGKAHRETLRREFYPSEFDGLASPIENIDKQRGTLILLTETLRIYRGKGRLRYVGSIHERIARADHKDLRLTYTDDFRVKHTGYGEAATGEKARRNYRLLQKSLAKNTRDDVGKALDMTYILREANMLGKYGEAADALQWLLEREDLIRQVHGSFFEAGVVITSWGMADARCCRERFSRLLLKKMLATDLGRYSKRYESDAVFSLSWSVAFRFVETELLAQMHTVPEHEAEVMSDEYFRMKEELYRAAAVAKERRHDRAGMFGFASKAITIGINSVVKDTFAAFYRAVKGLADADIIKFLDTLVQQDNQGTMDKLVVGSQFVGLRMVFLYYAMKAYKIGVLSPFNYCYMLMVSGKYREALAFLAENAKAEEQDAQKAALLALLCSASPALLQEWAGCLGPYAPLAKAYIGGEALGAQQQDETAGVLKYIYTRLAFARDMTAADRLLALYPRHAGLCFDLQAEYYMDCGMYREYLAADAIRPAENDWARQLVLADIYVRAGSPRQALAILSRLAFCEQFSDELFNLLQAVAEMNAGQPSIDARHLYDKYFASYDEYVDYRDIVRTGYIPWHDGQKQKKAMARMKPEEFDRWLGEEKPFAIKAYWPTCLEAAEKLAEKGSLYAAFCCLFKLLAAGYEAQRVKELLAVVFGRAGNQALPQHLAQSSEEGGA